MLLPALALSLLLCSQGPMVSVRAGSDAVSAAQVDATQRQAEAALARLAPLFPGSRGGPFEIVVHADAASLPAELRDNLHEGTAGVAWLPHRQVHLILDALRLHPPHDPRTVIEHELVHVLLHEFAGNAGPWVPRWFHEGLAQAISGHTYLGASEEDIVFYARTGGLPGFYNLRDKFPRDEFSRRIAYAQSFSFVSFLMSRVGLPELLAAAARCGPETDFSESFRARTGVALIDFEQEWLEYVKSGSGAAMRILLGSCFGLLMVAALPLLVLAGIRKWNRDHRSRLQLQREAEGDIGDEQAAPDRDA